MRRITDRHELEKRRDEMWEKLASTGDLRPGSLVGRYRKCGKQNCHCATEEDGGHGPSWSLTRRFGGKTVTRVVPASAVAQTQELLIAQDKVLKSFPEVERVFGKAGRAETSTDPAPFSMLETTIVLKPHDQWRRVDRFYSDWPQAFQGPFRRIWPDRISREDLVNDLNSRLQLPGLANAWTMPIRGAGQRPDTGREVRRPLQRQNR